MSWKDRLKGAAQGLVAGPAGAIYGGIVGSDKLEDQVGGLLGTKAADTSTTRAAIAGQSAFADQLRGQYGQLGTTAAPTIAHDYGVAPTRIESQRVGGAPTVAAGNVQPAGTIQGARVAPIQQVRAQAVQGSNLGQALQASGYGAATTNIQRPTGLDPQLGRAYGLLSDAAEGKAPSVAQGQMRQGLDEAIAAQMGAAASARGRNIGLAQRGAMMMGARMQQKGANDAAMLRAKEMEDARNAYTQALQAGRGQDIGMATADANNANQIATHNSSLATDISKYNANTVNQRTLDQANMNLDVGKYNSTQGFNAQVANQGVDASAKMAEAGYSQDAAKTNIANALDVNKTNVANTLQAQTTSAGLLQAGQFKQADIDLAIAGKNAQLVNDLALEMAKLGVEVNTQNAANILTQRGLDDNRSIALAKAINDSYSNILGGGKSLTEASSAANANKAAIAGGVIGGAAGLAGKKA